MTFRLDLANRAGLFQHYASWHEDNNILDRTHVSFTFAICYLINSIENINKYKKESIRQYYLLKDDLEIDAQEICFQSPSLFNLFSEISVSLTQIRIVQNCLIEILGKKLKNSLPSSMSDYVKKNKRRDKNETESKIYSLIFDYWKESGLDVKHYRDVDQHFGHLFHNALIMISENSIDLELRIPDNPKVKSWKKFTYHKKYDAIKFILESFEALHRLINDVSVALGYTRERLFDLNMDLNGEYDGFLTIVFDPYRGVIHGQEVFREDGDFYGVTHVKYCDLEEFSFVKVPEYFNGKPLPKKDIIVGEKFKLDMR